MWNLVIVVLGCVVLVGLAILVARLADQEARRSAWGRIAVQRRLIADAARSVARCPRCGARIRPFGPHER